MTSPEQKNARVSARQAVAERERQAFALRIAGANYRQIADQLGYRSRQGAEQAVARYRRSAAPIPSPEAARADESERLDTLWRSLWPLGIGTPAAPGRSAQAPNLSAVDRLLGIHDRRVRLLGLLREPVVDVEAELRKLAEAEGWDAAELVADGLGVVRQYEPRGRGRLRAV